MNKKIVIVGLAVGILFSGSVLAEESKLGYQGEEVISLMGDVWNKAKNSKIIDGVSESEKSSCQAYPDEICYRFNTGRMTIQELNSYSFRDGSGSIIPNSSKEMVFQPDNVGYEIYYIEGMPNLYAFTEFGAMHIFNNGFWVEEGPWVEMASIHLMVEINRLESISFARKQNFKKVFSENATRPKTQDDQKTIQKN